MRIDPVAVADLGQAETLPGRIQRDTLFGRLLLQSGSFAFTDIGDRNHRGPLFDPVVAFMNRFRAEPTAVSERVFVSCSVRNWVSVSAVCFTASMTAPL